jgi:hypothetical protein
MTPDKFRREARPLKGVLNGLPIEVKPKEFRSGSYGFYYWAKLYVNVGNEAVECQCGLNITVVGSKPKV